MSCSSSNTLVIQRSTQEQYNYLQAQTNSGCGNGGTAACSSVVGPLDRNLSKRKYREKIREQLKDYVLLMLGAPRVTIELDSQQLDLAVDQSLKIFEDYAGREYFNYHTFKTSPGKSVYKMPDDIGIVRNVFYRETGQMGFRSEDIGGTIPIEYFYPGSGAGMGGMGGVANPVQPMWGHAGEWVLYKSYETLFSGISSQIGGWEWISDTRHIKLYPIPTAGQTVMVHYLQKCKDWTEVNQAMQEGALCHAMIMLGHIRSKFTSPTGPGGGGQLDGEYMKTKGWELKEKWEENLLYKWGDIPPITMG